MSDVESLDGNLDIAQSTPSRSPSPGMKRKRDTGKDETANRQSTKRKRTKKPRDIIDDHLDEELGINTAIGRMDSRLLCDIVAQRTRRFEPELSSVELDDKYLPSSAVRDTSEWTHARATDHLPDFMKICATENLSKAPKEKGHPHTLVVAAAGLRAADLTRTLRTFETKDVKIAKLFAKHIKLKEAVERCKGSRMSFGVGTPQRIDDLLENGALSAKKLQRIVIDASHIDQKKRGILDMRETLLPLVQLLSRKEFKERYGRGDHPLELVFF